MKTRGWDGDLGRWMVGVSHKQTSIQSQEGLPGHPSQDGSHQAEVGSMERVPGEGGPAILTRLATLSGVSRGCRNSAVMSVSDWPEIWAEALDVPDGPGSRSLSSSSSPRLGSGIRENKRLASGPRSPRDLSSQAAILTPPSQRHTALANSPSLSGPQRSSSGKWERAGPLPEDLTKPEEYNV